MTITVAEANIIAEFCNSSIILGNLNFEWTDNVRYSVSRAAADQLAILTGGMVNPTRLDTVSKASVGTSGDYLTLTLSNNSILNIPYTTAATTTS
jgi:hypothetical protein